MLEHCIFGFTVVATLVWLDYVPASIIQDAAVVLLGWAVFSTALVASAGAWVAFARARARAARPDSRLNTRRG